MSAPIRYLSPDHGPLPRSLAHEAVAAMPQAGLAEPGALRAASAILVPVHADQHQLDSVRPVLEHFLATGGTIVVCGQIHQPFLPDLRPFEPLALESVEELAVRIEAHHPIWAGVEPDDLTFRNGVAGEYGGGANPPPPGAAVLTTVGRGRMAVDWLVEGYDGGRLLVHGGGDLWSFADGATSAARLAPQLIAWLLAESHPGGVP
jgi:hypothetical protein